MIHAPNAGKELKVKKDEGKPSANSVALATTVTPKTKDMVKEPQNFRGAELVRYRAGGDLKRHMGLGWGVGNTKNTPDKYYQQ